ncbi:condensation domain-containing protein, partial [Pyxidicoccus sp. 3LG]
ARSGALPLSFAQQRLWFLDLLEPDSPRYNIPAAVRMAGALDVTALERALAELVQRHESLRTCFPADASGNPVQAVTPTAEVPLGRVDLSSLSAEHRGEEVARLAREEALRPFQLAHGPLLRTTLLRLAETEHVLLLTMHHIVSDGWSMGVLVREVAELYRAFQAGQPSPLPALAVQYADFAAWQRGWLKDGALEQQLAYWREQLAGAPQVLELPADHPSPPVQTSRGARVPVKLPRAVSAALVRWGIARERRPSWCCSPASRRCCTATRVRTTSWWARP